MGTHTTFLKTVAGEAHRDIIHRLVEGLAIQELRCSSGVTNYGSWAATERSEKADLETCKHLPVPSLPTLTLVRMGDGASVPRGMVVLL